MKVGLSCRGEVKLVTLRWLQVAGHWDDCKSICCVQTLSTV